MTAVLLVLTAAPQLLLQDGGRRGCGRFGVSRSGAFDEPSRGLANRLVGNDVDAAVVECLLGPSSYRVLGPAIVAVTGARADVRVNGRLVGQDAAIALGADDIFQIGQAHQGLRVYLALRGGFHAPVVLGSRSWDTLSEVGPRPFGLGDELQCAHMSCSSEPWFETVPVVRSFADIVVPIVAGPRLDWFPENTLSRLVSERWTVDAASDRRGVRLSGALLGRRPEFVDRELASEAMIPGAMQIPPNGQPVLLGPDCGTTGGYPVLAVAVDDGLGRIAQAVPGSLLRFRLT